MSEETYINDISKEQARQAFTWTSQDPDGRGDRTRREYAESMDKTYNWGIEYARNESEKEIFLAWFEQYRMKMRSLWMTWLSSESRCASTFITGGSNFPARKMEKRNNYAHNHLTRLIEVEKWMRSKIARAMRPELRPIMSGDADALERLKEKIDKAEKLQAHMKSVNALIRKNKNETPERQAELLAEFAGWKLTTATELLKPDWCGRIGYADYELTNNNANLRRMKERLAVIERNKDRPAVSVEKTSGIKVEDCPAENRVKIFFPGKPDFEVRSKLKGCGYRWAPSIGAWQAYRNSRTLELAKAI